MPRPFRFAVQAVKARSAEEWRTFARRTEALGYSTLFLADHYLGPGPALQEAPQPLQHLAPIAAAAAIAAMGARCWRGWGASWSAGPGPR